MTYSPLTPSEIIYPASDGKPMAESTKQYLWIVVIKENLEILLSENLDAFIAGDLFWYPIEGNSAVCLAPDVMVVMGRPKGHRSSYLQWKERNIPPQVVFEIMSPSNTQREMQEKRSFYETHGVDEFYIYDPERFKLSGHIRQGGQLLPILNLEGWVSPILQIRFTKINGNLEIYRPDGRRFLTSVELEQRAITAETERDTAQQERDTAQQERDTAQQERDTAQQERDQLAERALQAEEERDRLRAQLRALGLNPDQV